MSEHTVNLEPEATKPFAGKVAAISGTSKGIGHGAAEALGGAGAKIAGCYVNPKSEPLQINLGLRLQELGTEFASEQADITTPEGRARFLESARSLSPDGKVDMLVLNAAGGYEQGKPPGWANIINNESQVALAREFLPHMRPGGEIVFMTSHWAYGAGEVRMIPFYGEVAETKRAAMEALRAMQPDFDAAGVKFGIVSAPLVKGTGAYSIFRRIAGEKLKALEEKMGGFPDAKEVGIHIRDFLLSPHNSGDVHFVRDYDLEPIPPEHLGPVEMDREQILAALPMYRNDVVNRVLVNSFATSDDRTSGTGWYEVTDLDCEGHFTEEYGGPVLPAHIRAEMAAQTAGLLLRAKEPDAPDALGMYQGFGTDLPPLEEGEEGEGDDRLIVDFTGGTSAGGLIFPGDRVKMHAEILAVRAGMFPAARVELSVDGAPMTVFQDLRLQIIPDKEFAVKITERARRNRLRSRERQSQEIASDVVVAPASPL